MATRTRYSSASHPVPWENVGASERFGDQYNRLLGTLFNASNLPLTAIGGTANDVTATMDPELDGGGLVDGMKATLTWASNNTGPMTLALNGGSPDPVLTGDGTTLFAGQVVAGDRALLEYIGGSWRILTGLTEDSSVRHDYQVFTASGTWIKPGGLDDDQTILVEAWGAGGGGGGDSGGGGGAYVLGRFRAGDLAASVAVTIGAGGPTLTAGGNTTFGTHLTAYGGGGGYTTNGGGGGGPMGAGSNASGAGGDSSGGLGGGGDGGQGSIMAQPAQNIYGGAGGGGNNQSGGWAIYGGGGGAGTGPNGGPSLYGGNGGNGGEAGGAPGGGGGETSGVGARGEVRVWVL